MVGSREQGAGRREKGGGRREEGGGGEGSSATMQVWGASTGSQKPSLLPGVNLAEESS